MDSIDNAIRNRSLVRITERSGHGKGLVGIALGYNAQYDSVKVGFVDDQGNYTGEYTKVGRSCVEILGEEAPEDPRVGEWFVERAHRTATPRFGPKWFTAAGPFKTERAGEVWLADNAHRLPSNRYWRVVLDSDD